MAVRVKNARKWRLAMSERPIKIPGQSRYPHKRIAASAIPLGGQTAEALGWTRASDKPKLPAQKYKTARIKINAAVWTYRVILSKMRRCLRIPTHDSLVRFMRFVNY